MDTTVIDTIVARVIEGLAERQIASASPCRVLMLFSGASTGYVAGLKAIRMLSGAGHPLHVVLSASAMHVIGEDTVRKAGAVTISGPDAWLNAPKVIGESDVVLVPTLSMNTAAHLALGLMDSLLTTLILGARLADKPVVAVLSGADPDGRGGRVFSATNTGAPALRAMLSGHLETLTSFGIQLVDDGQFLWAAAQAVAGPAGVKSAATKSAATTSAAAARAAATAATLRLSGLVTASDLSGLTQGATVSLAAGARLTPLAQEVLERQRVRVMNGHQEVLA